eukprot:Rmarinus@m.24611
MQQHQYSGMQPGGMQPSGQLYLGQPQPTMVYGQPQTNGQPGSYGQSQPYGQPSNPGQQGGQIPTLERPTCPQFTMTVPGGYRPALLQSMKVTVQVHIATAFVTVEGEWINNAAGNACAILQVPTDRHTTVTHVDMLVGERILETLVAAQEDAKGSVKNPGEQSYNPELFALPVEKVPLNERMRAKIVFFQDLEFRQGKYNLDIPLTIPQTALAPGVRIEQVLSISIDILTGTPNCSWGAASHPLQTVNMSPGFISLAADRNAPWQNTDFSISYHTHTNEILASLLVTGPTPGEYDERGSFAMFVAPPPPESVPHTFGRNIYFIIDRSGSMSGQPMDDAKKALTHGLSLLSPNDNFNIIAFDDQQEYYSKGLVAATPQNIQAAQQWVSMIRARALTDILTPLSHAVGELENAEHANVPFVFLITDGAVQNEREICQYARANAKRSRISTFGIGPYCNAYFLQMLAELGRGFYDLAFNPEKIFLQMSSLLEKASAPILTDVSLGIQGVSNVEIYPFPVPDLFIGAPLLICGKFSGQFPTTVMLQGRHSSGQALQIPVQAVASSVNLDKVFIKKRLDLLTAKAWLEDSQKIKEQVVDLSVASNVPCAHTVMVAYETTPAKKAEWEKKKDKEKNPAKRSKAKLALLGVGAGIAVGAALMTFGDVGATFANSSTFEAMGDFLGNGAQEFAGVVGDAFAGLGDVIGDAGGAIGDAMGGLGDALGDAAGGVGDAVGDAGDMCGDCFGSIGGVCEGIPDALEGVGESCGEGCGAFCQSLEGLDFGDVNFGDCSIM